MRQRAVIIYNITFLAFLFFVIAFFFALVYMIFDFLKIGLIMDHYASSTHQENPIDLFTRSFYFSFITLFSVGYGDMTPFGLSKGVAIIEATIGHVLPIAIVIKYILFTPKSFRNLIVNYDRKKRLR